MDGDGWIKPTLLQFVREKLTASPTRPDMVLFGAACIYPDRTEALVNRLPDGYYDRARLEKEVFPYLLSDRRRGFYIGTQIQCHSWNKPCRRELQVKFHVRDERISLLEDVPLSYECLLNCQSVYLCSEPLYCYNQMNADSLLARSHAFFLTEEVGILVRYLQARLAPYGPDIRRQLNDYPAHLILRSAIALLRHGTPLRRAKREIRAGLESSGLLDCISLSGLPIKPRLVMLLFKHRCDTAAMLLCAIKARRRPTAS